MPRYMRRNQEFPTRDALAAADAVWQDQGFIKSDQSGAEKPSNVQRVKVTLNPDQLPPWLADVPGVQVTDQNRERAHELEQFCSLMAVEAIQGNLSDFDRKVIGLVRSPTVREVDLGLLSYVPELVNRREHYEQQHTQVEEVANTSQWIGKIKARCEHTVTIVHKLYSHNYQAYFYMACDAQGNLVRFINAKDLGDESQTIRIKATIRNHEIDERNLDARVTYVNRVVLLP